MAAFNPRESIGFHCSLTYRAFRSALEQRLKGSGVRPTQLIALAHLVALGPLPQAELAALLSITPASAVRLIDRMERDGWVERRPAPQDRRVNLVAPTGEALVVWEELSTYPVDLLRQAYDGIPAEDIQLVLRTLARIRTNLGAE